MRAKRFVEAVKQLKFAEVLLDGDFRRVNDLYAEAIEHSEDHVLVGFRVRGPMVRIVWAAIEVIGSVADKDLPPDHSAIRGPATWHSASTASGSARGQRRSWLNSTTRS